MINGGRRIYTVVIAKAAKQLNNWKKFIRFGVNYNDILIKGYHVHFDGIAKGLEMGLVPTNEGLALRQVGKLTVGTAEEVGKAVNLFGQAMANARFRSQLIMKLHVTQEYLEQGYKFTKSYNQASERIQEINLIIKSIPK